MVNMRLLSRKIFVKLTRNTNLISIVRNLNTRDLRIDNIRRETKLSELTTANSATTKTARGLRRNPKHDTNLGLIRRVINIDSATNRHRLSFNTNSVMNHFLRANNTARLVRLRNVIKNTNRPVINNARNHLRRTTNDAGSGNDTNVNSRKLIRLLIKRERGLRTDTLGRADRLTNNSKSVRVNRAILIRFLATRLRLLNNAKRSKRKRGLHQISTLLLHVMNLRGATGRLLKELANKRIVRLLKRMRLNRLSPTKETKNGRKRNTTILSTLRRLVNLLRSNRINDTINFRRLIGTPATRDNRRLTLRVNASERARTLTRNNTRNKNDLCRRGLIKIKRNNPRLNNIILLNRNTNKTGRDTLATKCTKNIIRKRLRNTNGINISATIVNTGGKRRLLLANNRTTTT